MSLQTLKILLKKIIKKVKTKMFKFKCLKNLIRFSNIVKFSMMAKKE
jgi:hypothetical protein